MKIYSHYKGLKGSWNPFLDNVVKIMIHLCEYLMIFLEKCHVILIEEIKEYLRPNFGKKGKQVHCVIYGAKL